MLKLDEPFQSTPSPRRTRGDQVALNGIAQCWCFDPRPRTGGDPSIGCAAGWLILFRSTPRTRGATQRPIGAIGLHVVSIHAPARGDSAERPHHGACRSFDPCAPRTGSDRMPTSSCVRSMMFRSTPSCGGDLSASLYPKTSTCFDPHPCGAPPSRSGCSSLMSRFDPRPARGATS